jgi:pimeloyl-ACP methyl ester carboxylesterase
MSETMSKSGSAAVVLVHGSFMDGSVWNKVIPILQSEGIEVVSVQNPLSSLEDDVAATARAIKSLDGPVVLVGQSWGGVVITEAGVDDKVKGLVYVAALAPDKGHSMGELFGNYEAMPGMNHITLDDDGYLHMTPVGIAEYFAHDLPASETSVMAAAQAPTAAICADTKVSYAAWKSKDCWYIVTTEDRMVSPKLMRDLAARMNARTTELQAGHAPMLSKPKEVAAVILEAARAAA